MEFEEFTRDEWGALESKAKIELWNPVAKILFTFGTNSKPCTTVKECKKACKDLQYRDMFLRRMPDINYNFLFGGDGNVYEGRGFSKKVSLQTFYPPNCLVIGMIGDFAVEDPPDIMFDLMDEFIKRYVLEGKIAPTWKKSYVR